MSLCCSSYRLCPASRELTEECFFQRPLRFVGNSSLRWGGAGGKRLYFNSSALGWETNVGTLPPGSSWRKNPLPRAPARGGVDWGWENFGASFEPVCQEPPECTAATGRTSWWHAPTRAAAKGPSERSRGASFLRSSPASVAAVTQNGSAWAHTRSW